MGALCGKESRDDNFTGPGRRLDSSPPERATAPLPSNKRVVGGPPRTLGGPSTASAGAGAGAGGASAADATDARRRAAEAAEVRQHRTRPRMMTPRELTISPQARAKAADGKATGKLGSQLQQQKKQTMNETMKQAAEEEARRREIETANDQRNYN